MTTTVRIAHYWKHPQTLVQHKPLDLVALDDDLARALVTTG